MSGRNRYGQRKATNGNLPTCRLVTVPHSGTRFTGALLDRLGIPLGRRVGGLWRTEHHTDDMGFPMPYVAEGDVVVAVRDPMLAEISRLNRGGSGLPVQEWSKVAAWVSEPRAHFFRVDWPTTQKQRELEVAELAAFVGLTELPVDVDLFDWTPVNVRPDALDLKERYARGEIADELEPAWTWLRRSKIVSKLFRRLEYDLPWMDMTAHRAVAHVSKRKR